MSILAECHQHARTGIKRHPKRHANVTQKEPKQAAGETANRQRQTEGRGKASAQPMRGGFGEEVRLVLAFSHGTFSFVQQSRRPRILQPIAFWFCTTSRRVSVPCVRKKWADLGRQSRNRRESISPRRLTIFARSFLFLCQGRALKLPVARCRNLRSSR